MSSVKVCPGLSDSRVWLPCKWWLRVSVCLYLVVMSSGIHGMKINETGEECAGVWCNSVDPEKTILPFFGRIWFHMSDCKRSGNWEEHIHIQWRVHSSTTECRKWKSIWPWYQKFFCPNTTENLALDLQRRKLISAYLSDLPLL